jgi:tRNA nucleotidyltransferase (CCA-adding enzyme)
MTRPLPQPVRIYRVGGSVRDELLQIPSGDDDWVVVGATPEIMVASGFMPVGKDFPVFLHPDTHDEYALARTERKHGRGYRGFEFFATPDVTLEDDLRRRDLTINAMARAPDGTLIDPHGGADDLRAGILRHVSPAFAEDPLRVLRVARFAARFGFAIADGTLALMRDIVAAGELATLSPERVWQELSRGLSEEHPSRMLRALRAVGALAALLPEIDALYATKHDGDDIGALTERALDWAAQHRFVLPVRYAALMTRLGETNAANAASNSSNRDGGGAEPVISKRSTRVAIARADAVSLRLKVPLECRDSARIAARFVVDATRANTLAPARLLDIIVAADALRRSDRLDWLIDSACAYAAAEQHADCAAPLLRDALAIIRGVDASTIARDAIARAASQQAPGAMATVGDAIGTALRNARLAALRRWRMARRAESR